DIVKDSKYLSDLKKFNSDYKDAADNSVPFDTFWSYLKTTTFIGSTPTVPRDPKGIPGAPKPPSTPARSPPIDLTTPLTPGTRDSMIEMEKTAADLAKDIKKSAEKTVEEIKRGTNNQVILKMLRGSLVPREGK